MLSMLNETDRSLDFSEGKGVSNGSINRDWCFRRNTLSTERKMDGQEAQLERG